MTLSFTLVIPKRTKEQALQPHSLYQDSGGCFLQIVELSSVFEMCLPVPSRPYVRYSLKEPPRKDKKLGVDVRRDDEDRHHKACY